MALDPRLLDILRCPATGQRLVELDAAGIAAVNRDISSGGVPLGDGSRWFQPIRAGLVTSSGDRAYRIDDGIPVLLIDQCLQLAQAHQSG